MKTKLIRIIAFCLFILLGTQVHAQNPNPNAPAKSSSPKDELVQKLNDFQPKLNDLMAKAKENSATMPELVTETDKLNSMVSDFKTKLDKFDITPRNEHEQYASNLQIDWSSIQAQYDKANSLLSSHANDGLKKQVDDQKPPKK